MDNDNDLPIHILFLEISDEKPAWFQQIASGLNVGQVYLQCCSVQLVTQVHQTVSSKRDLHPDLATLLTFHYSMFYSLTDG